MKEVDGNLITLAQSGEFDVIAHGCNCFCTMGAGIAPQMAEAFGCNNPIWYEMEHPSRRGDKLKLGNIEGHMVLANNSLQPKMVTVYNMYTQYDTVGIHPLDLEALTLCLRKLNYLEKGKHIGLPLVGCGLAGGNWTEVHDIMKRELKDCELTVVHFKNSNLD